jgi:large subunit ribosomal protein L18
MIKRKNATGSHAKQKNKKSIVGSSEKPRLTVYRSLNHIYAQIIDDSSGKTLVSGSTLSKDISEELKTLKGKIAKSKAVGSLVAKKALNQKIKSVIFDRNGYRYHGRVQAVADGAREGGLKF